jgi:hypothetical protein
LHGRKAFRVDENITRDIQMAEYQFRAVNWRYMVGDE